MPRKTKKRKRPATAGTFYDFHGAFTSKAAAERKARKVGGFFVARTPRGTKVKRYIVVANDTGFNV